MAESRPCVCYRTLEIDPAAGDSGGPLRLFYMGGVEPPVYDLTPERAREIAGLARVQVA